MDPVGKRDVECQLTQFSVDGQIACVRAPVQVERMTIRVWLFDVAAGCLEQRLDPLGAVKEKFQHRDARAAHGAVTRRVAWGRGWAFGKCLWKQVGPVSRKDPAERR